MNLKSRMEKIEKSQRQSDERIPECPSNFHRARMVAFIFNKGVREDSGPDRELAEKVADILNVPLTQVTA